MQVLVTATTSDTYTVELVIPKSQVTMLAKRGAILVDKCGKSYSINALILSDCKSRDHGISNPTANEGTNTPYIIKPALSPSYTKEEITSSKISASLMSSGEWKKVDDTGDSSRCNDNAGMGESSNWKKAPQLIISAVTSKTQDGNLNNSGANISTSGPHGRRCSDYYLGLNKVMDMTDLVNPNAVSLCYDDF